MSRLSIIIGAGGTGSYFIPMYLQQKPTSIYDKLIVMDGDVVESKNLLRQGFFKESNQMSKSKALNKMYLEKINVLADFQHMFLNSSDELLKVVVNIKHSFDEIYLFSCVDNNIARLRLLVGMNFLKEVFPQTRVVFIDSGNEEWFGQSLITALEPSDKPFLTFKNETFSLNLENDLSKVNSIFFYIDSWQDYLTRGDHEMSCAYVVVSAPQNIATNMMASNVMLTCFKKYVDEKQLVNYYFDCLKNFTMVKESLPNETKRQVLQEIVDFLNSDLKKDVLSEEFKSVTDVRENTFKVKDFVKKDKDELLTILKQDISLGSIKRDHVSEKAKDIINDDLFLDVSFLEKNKSSNTENNVETSILKDIENDLKNPFDTSPVAFLEEEELKNLFDITPNTFSEEEKGNKNTIMEKIKRANKQINDNILDVFIESDKPINNSDIQDIDLSDFFETF